MIIISRKLTTYIFPIYFSIGYVIYLSFICSNKMLLKIFVFCLKILVSFAISDKKKMLFKNLIPVTETVLFLFCVHNCFALC